VVEVDQEEIQQLLLLVEMVVEQELEMVVICQMVQDQMQELQIEVLAVVEVVELVILVVEMDQEEW
tara:strand:- start:46 stop:243 length:198 start_codon:yes stop_codon:yes gene_type:complete